MACPSGCLNGGGQIKPEERNPQAGKELVAKLDKVLLVYNRPNKDDLFILLCGVIRFIMKGSANRTQLWSTFLHQCSIYMMSG